METPELLALSLGLSVVAGGLARIGGGLAERWSADPVLRDRFWAAALALPAVPPLAAGLILMTPAPVREIAGAPSAVAAVEGAVTTAAPSAPAVWTLDPTLAAWVIVGLAALLAAVRLAALALRAGRLWRVIRRAEPAGPEIAAIVGTAARDLAVPAPRVGVSAAVPEALLASLGAVRLILPVDLAGTANAAATRAVIAHELAHLKRGDHHVLWAEEVLLALLAFNPLMPPLRARRAAAREEACDAVALEGAAPGTRRAYAQSLIDALRSRAAPGGAGGLPALTFTGAGRTTAMHRLKAVLNPPARAGRRTRLAVAAAGCALVAAVAVGSVAVAAQREPVVRLAQAPDRVAVQVMINGQPVALDFSKLPPFGLQADSIVASAAGVLPVWTDFRTTPDPDAPPLSLEGVRLPAGVTTDIVRSSDIERVDRTPAGLNIVLKRESDAQDTLPARPASPGRRVRDLSAQAYRETCASNDVADGGFCAGVMFSALERAPENGVCAPEDDLGAFVNGGRREIARLQPNAGEGAYGFAERALKQAWPCRTDAMTRGQAGENLVPLNVSVDMDGRPLTVGADEVLRVILTDETGAVVNTFGAGSTGTGGSGPLGPLGMAFAAADVPRAWESTRTFTLTGEIRGPDRVLRYIAEPVTLRLAPGARRADLRPTLSFRPT